MIIKNPLAPQETQLKRLEICNTCPSISQNKKKCTECGCYLEYKVWLNSSSCPLKRW